MIWLLLSLFLRAYVPQGATSLDDLRFPVTYYDESSGRTFCYRDKCAATAPAPVFVSQLSDYLPTVLSTEDICCFDGDFGQPRWRNIWMSECRLIHCRKGMKFNAGDDLVSCNDGYACIPEGAYTLNVCATLENGRIWCDQQ